MWEIYSCLMCLLGERGKFSQQLFMDMHLIRDSLDSPSPWADEQLCFCALRIAKTLGRRLPDLVHNRMVIGLQNERTRQYVAFCSKKGF